ncbi:hypothetical protein B4147_0371 [Bacillus wiedmannii]|uniref:Uncharacterized protein n=1 Tax=Bacillus wiedmannii TaxID=1890302 RepID=A0A0G8BUI5_9BACI|nr:hypothetical protein B4147_0371 [Bacillus wiedmannii]
MLLILLLHLLILRSHLLLLVILALSFYVSSFLISYLYVISKKCLFHSFYVSVTLKLLT